MSKIIYLAAYKANHPNYDMVYQDINGLRDIGGDMMNVDLEPYDIIIANPPCNYYSRARGNRKPSQYAEDTKHLLPDILNKLNKLNKKYIVENVKNFKQLGKYFNHAAYVYEYGRHTYWTNIPFNPSQIEQIQDFKSGGKRQHSGTQGGLNVHNVIEHWLQVVTS